MSGMAWCLLEPYAGNGIEIIIWDGAFADEI